jgi:hypothetical protein
MKMATQTTQTTTIKRVNITYAGPKYAAPKSLIGRFFDWSKTQEERRLLWLGVALSAHGCVLTPLTVLAVVLAGASLPMLVIALVAMMMSLVTNLAAMPTRITIPVFVLSVLIDLTLIITSLAIGFNISSTYI